MSNDRPVTDEDVAADSIARVERSKHDAMSWYDWLSPWYDLLVARFDRRPRNRATELLDVQDGQRVLEVGAGTGQALVSFAGDVGSAGHVVGLDISEGMCSVACETVIEAHVPDRVSVVRGDAQQLPFESEAFDAMFASFTLELFDTPALPSVLGEWRRVLRDDGRLGVVALSKLDAGVVTLAYERFHTLFPQYADCRPIYARELLDSAGFTVVEMETLQLWGLTVEVGIVQPTS